MAYTTIDKPSDYFDTIIYTGNGSDPRTLTGVGFQPDWVWTKKRNGATGHRLVDSVRGVTKALFTNGTNVESTESNGLTAFASDGYTLGDNGNYNANSDTYVSWNWLASGTAPSQTYTVKVVSDSGNKYRFDDFGTSAVTLDLQEGGTYTFDQSDSSNSGHPLRFSTTSDGTHGGGSEYTTNVTTTGTPGSAGAKTVITVASSAPTLYYYCSVHSGMGGQANTNTTHGSSNFSGSIQANVSANTTAGFSAVSYTGTGSNATIGHGLGVAPKMIIIKNLGATQGWCVYHESIGATKFLSLNSTDAQVTASDRFNDTSPTSSVFSVGTHADTNGSSATYVAYCFAEKKGYSKFGSYTGNASADGTFVYTGFKPAFFMVKRTDTTNDWQMHDSTRDTFNGVTQRLRANLSDAEATTGAFYDFTSTGVKVRNTDFSMNASGGTYIYMAFAESPFVTAGTKAAGTAR
jgi:hypothetical protein